MALALPQMRRNHRSYPNQSPARSLVTTALCAPLLFSGCLERELGLQGPRTTSLVSELLKQAPPTKLDLLLVVDNSLSMSDKQEVLAAALPDLIRNLAVPPCVTPEGDRVARDAADLCPPRSAPEFEALRDIQVGIITTSLGSSGGESEGGCDNEESLDMAHLLPTRPRASHIPSDGGVLIWKAGQDLDAFVKHVGSVVTLAGQNGCGQESTLEAWYRFLVDPSPYTRLVRAGCDAGDEARRCASREAGADGKPAVDTELLAQRAKFLRPDSLVAVVMLSDENDCSLKEHPQAWVLEDTSFMWRGSRACESDPNSACCTPCATTTYPNECETETVTVTDETGKQTQKAVPAGCGENNGYYSEDDMEAPNLRCFDQKRRFGVDLLQPTSRYVNALTQQRLCRTTASGNPMDCATTDLFDNPLYAQSGTFARTGPDSVLLVGILGTPWQDLAKTPDPTQPLEYLPAAAQPGEAALNWSWLLPSEQQDPLMRESIEPRTGTNPATGVPLAPPGTPRYSNPINGHEHANLARDELQYACIFPLPGAARDCGQDSSDDCDCMDPNPEVEGNPLCQSADGEFGTTQYFAKAYPGLRELQVLKDVGESAVVASICAKEMTDTDAPDFGYRPAMQAIVDKVKTKLTELCFDRELSTNEEGRTNCRVIELQPTASSCSCTGTRLEPRKAALDSVRRLLVQKGVCQTDAECAAMCACEIDQVPPAPNHGLNSCQTDEQSTDNGWCYVEANKSEASARLVSQCADQAQRTVRFVGDGVPLESSVTFLACQGSTYEQ